jgi:ATP-binding cassette subfamily B protein
MSNIKQELRFILSKIKNRPKLYWGVFAALLSSGLLAIIPYLYGRLIDLAIQPNSSLAIILKFIIFWIIISLGADFLDRYSEKNSYEITIDLTNDLTVDLYNHILNLPISFHKEQKIGEVTRKIDKGVEGIYNIIEDVLFSFLPTIISFFIALLILFSVEWRLSTILLITIFFFIWLTIVYTKKIIKIQTLLHQSYEKAYGNLFDALRNAQTVKANTAEHFEYKKSIKQWNSAGEVEKIFRSLWLQMGLWQKIITTISLGSIFSLGILMLRNGHLTPGKLLMFVGYISLLTNPLYKLASQYRSLNSSLVSLRRAILFYDYQEEKDFKNAKDINIKGEIEFKNVSFYYKKGNPILIDISFYVQPGEKIAIVGESGVGKTTLVDLIGRYYLPQKGEIFIDGLNIKKIKLTSLRRQIAVVPQEVALFNGTIKENIRYGRPNATDKEIIEAARVANASEFIEKFPKKYNQIVGERGIKLSVGQKQRIAIARAILRNPKILILDEATSALDSASEKLVQEGLNNLIQGRTSFIIAHRLSTIKNADKILVLKDGKIVEMGKHEDLIQKPNGIYRKFWELQGTLSEKI